MLLQEARQPGRDHARAQHFGHAQAHHAAHRHLRVAQLLLGGDGRAFHGFRMRQQRMAHLGELVAFAAAVEQGGAQLHLEPVDAARHRRVLDGQAARGARQRAGARKLQEIA